MSTRPIITCACCGKSGHHRAHGWRDYCYTRWFKAGKPAGGPPPVQEESTEPAFAAHMAAFAGRLADYQWLLQRERRLTAQQAADRMGVSLRTVRRWNALLASGQAPAILEAAA
jgi:hypothetical protein